MASGPATSRVSGPVVVTAMFVKYGKINEASKVLGDPLLLSTILLRLPSIKSVRKKGKAQLVVTALAKFSREAIEQRAAVFAKLEIGGYVFRLVTLGEIVVAIIGENEEALVGEDAFSQLFSLVKEGGESSLWGSAARVDDYPEELRVYLSQALVERLGKPPDVWIGRKLYDIEIKNVISSRGRFMYVLRGEDVLGNQYAVKIPREEILVEKGLNTVAVLRGYLNALSVATAELSEIRSNLEEQGHSPSNAESLSYYRRYIARPRIIIMPADKYTGLIEYINAPPMVAEEYYDQGDFAKLLKSKKKLGLAVSIYFISRIAGALALAHSLNIIHADLKPANILLYRCDEHQAIKYCPSLDDFAPLPRGAPRHDRVATNVATPLYADPVSLMLGEASKRFDVYSLGMTAFQAFTGTVIMPRLVLNSLILSYFHGMETQVKQLLSKNKDLEALAAKLEPIILDIKNSRRVRDRVEEAINILSDAESRYYELLRATIPYPIYRVVRSMTSLVYEERPRDAVEAWSNFFKAVSEAGLAQVLPQQAMPQ